jgi:hypothetical protein
LPQSGQDADLARYPAPLPSAGLGIAEIRRLVDIATARSAGPCATREWVGQAVKAAKKHLVQGSGANGNGSAGRSKEGPSLKGLSLKLGQGEMMEIKEKG